jgi:hypothetical protein
MQSNVMPGELEHGSHVAWGDQECGILVKLSYNIHYLTFCGNRIKLGQGQKQLETKTWLEHC